MMQIVGNELARLALSNHNPVEADLLGRSAFNRYYYAAFLTTRNTLGCMQDNWKGTAHANIPTLLKDGLRKPAEAAIDKQLRVGLLDKGDKARLLANIKAVGSELAELLKHAYDARILADYEPEIKTVIDNNVIALKSYKITTAKQWPDRANLLCSRLLGLWKEIGLV
ncbi:hypothetical protein N5J40_02740 [Aeromonas caviae]|uniref:hypothetical protein n=1 Tax=Aeromonas caviae TaxID=648 RepID=UPI0024469A17|nr:hypothetical protein [Aeromonas caviae]MDH1993773.1 hypothetical protein [Aeromonas caviae]